MTRFSDTAVISSRRGLARRPRERERIPRRWHVRDQRSGKQRDISRRGGATARGQARTDNVRTGATVQLVLASLGSIAGVAEDAEGKPVQNLMLQIHNPQTGQQRSEVVFDARGSFRLENVTPVAVQIAAADRFGNMAVTVQQLRAKERLADLRLRFARRRRADPRSRTVRRLRHANTACSQWPPSVRTRGRDRHGAQTTGQMLVATLCRPPLSLAPACIARSAYRGRLRSAQSFRQYRSAMDA